MPILLLLFLFYFGLFEVIGLNLSTITASCLVLGMASAAYQSQIFRGSIETLPVGQFRAARALGMNDGQAIRHIVLPLYITAGLLYFGITLVGVHILRVLERKVHIPGYAVSGSM